MKKVYALLVVTSLLLVANIGVNLARPRVTAQAQSNPGGIEWVQPATSVSGCIWPSWAGTGTITAIAICPVNTGVASTSGVSFALNGGTFSPVFPVTGPGAAASGVTSFGNPPRTGAVVLTKADIQQSGISAVATVTAPTTTVSAPAVSATAPSATTTAPSVTISLQ